MLRTLVLGLELSYLSNVISLGLKRKIPAFGAPAGEAGKLKMGAVSSAKLTNENLGSAFEMEEKRELLLPGAPKPRLALDRN